MHKQMSMFCVFEDSIETQLTAFMFHTQWWHPDTLVRSSTAKNFVEDRRSFVLLPTDLK